MSFHLYTINELYSNADGSNQFIELTVDNYDGQGFWAGHFIRVTQGGTSHNLTFTANLPSEATANTKVLIATQGFANLGIVTPDFIVPSGFLFTNGGIVNFAGVDSYSYAALPTDGVTSLGRSGGRVAASPTDFAGATGTLPPSSGGGNGTLPDTSGNDTLLSSAGNDTLDGGAGIDTVVYSGMRSHYTVTKTATGYSVTDNVSTDGTDTLANVEQLKFTDMTVNLTIQAKAAAAPQADVQRITELYVAFFNRVPDADGLAYWIDQKNGGQSINQIAESFYNAGVQNSTLTGYSTTMSNQDFINVVYKNVLGRSGGADQGGLDYWNGELTSGRASHGSLVSDILNSAHTFKNDATYGWVSDLLDNKITVANKFAIDLGLSYNTANDSITHGMAIEAAVTPTSTADAIALIGIQGVSTAGTTASSPDMPSSPYNYGN